MEQVKEKEDGGKPKNFLEKVKKIQKMSFKS
jgi:hypothetical protein